MWLETVIQKMIISLDKETIQLQQPRFSQLIFYSPKVQPGNDLRIVHLSDQHNCLLDGTWIKENILPFSPHLIAITGDGGHNQKRNENYRSSYLNFLETCQLLVSMAPVYYVEGNHDHFNESLLPQLAKDLAAIGVSFLRDGCFEELNMNCRVIGVSDSFLIEDVSHQLKKSFNWIEAIEANGAVFNLLLAHRAAQKYREIYSEFPIDLVLSGHAHGGQWRIPFLGIGLAAPDEGLLPKSTNGLLSINNNWTHISRGCAKCFGPRFLNPPEITLINIRNGLIEQNKPAKNFGLNIWADKILR